MIAVNFFFFFFLQAALADVRVSPVPASIDPTSSTTSSSLSAGAQDMPCGAFVCPDNHPMVELTAPPPTYRFNNVRCDNCTNKIRCSDGFLHCEVCKFDVCRHCKNAQVGSSVDSFNTGARAGAGAGAGAAEESRELENYHPGYFLNSAVSIILNLSTTALLFFPTLSFYF